MHEPNEVGVLVGGAMSSLKIIISSIFIIQYDVLLSSVIDEDFTLNQTQQIFYYQASTEVCLQFRIINDMFIENDSEMLILETTLDNNNDTIEGPDSVHIRISDNDCKYVQQFTYHLYDKLEALIILYYYTK